MSETSFNSLWKKESPNQSQQDDALIRDTNSHQQDDDSKNSSWKQKEAPARKESEIRTGQKLEVRAREIVRRGTAWGSSASGTVTRELALTLDAIENVRTIFDQVECSLLDAECAAGTELLQAPEPPEQARTRIFSIEAERRRHTIAKNEQMRTLHRELLILLNKHAILALND